LLRTSVLLFGDSVATLIGLYVTVAAVGGAIGDPLSYLPRLLVMVIFGQAAAGTYGAGRAHGNYAQVLKGVAAAVFARLSIDALYGVGAFDLPGYVALAIVLGVTLSTGRFVVARAVRRAYSRGIGQKRTLIVAERDQAFDVLERFRAADEPRIRTMGHLVADAATDPTALGSVNDIGRFIEELDVSYVVVAGQLPRDQFECVVRTCFLHGAAVSVAPGTLTSIPCRVASREVLGWPLIELQAPRMHLLQVALKRALDALLSFLLLILLAPVFGLIALAIRLESRGPVVFRQSRPGLAGKRFFMYKFRTMRPDAEAILQSDPELFKEFLENDCKLPAERDPRISKVGGFLRRTSLDELPQLWNVLRGDMSLIGPRPVVGPELEHYGSWTSTVLGVRPGMTGYWQVAGRSQIMYPERAHLDIFYVTRWSLGLDLKILLLTLPAVVRRSGAF
jgi:exopolysaccharide biosynthesis polyprenyl glycosylphosphotransferase